MIRIENFSLQQIVINDEQSNEDYRSCLNENSQLNFKSNGLYPNCTAALNKLSSSGFGPNDNIGFGTFKDVCPISCLTKIPSDCLEKRLKNQDQTIDDISKTLTDFSSNEQLYRSKLDSDISNQQVFSSSLYNNPEILEVLNYINKYGYPTNNTDYNNIITKYLKEFPEATVTPSPTDNLTPPQIVFSNNKNMKLSSRLDTSALLGY
jgi:uncharacterized coiled-coil protein SlyX